MTTYILITSHFDLESIWATTDKQACLFEAHNHFGAHCWNWWKRRGDTQLTTEEMRQCDIRMIKVPDTNSLDENDVIEVPTEIAIPYQKWYSEWYQERVEEERRESDLKVKDYETYKRLHRTYGAQLRKENGLNEVTDEEMKYVRAGHFRDRR